ncbi:MAG: hypothetical protein KatS3mg124_1824 [Porticoccaceae bacterium]|nr:MAG: hypothetical protein KatS3mg124_1824 [Porticoccaceae bacterium]
MPAGELDPAEWYLRPYRAVRLETIGALVEERLAGQVAAQVFGEKGPENPASSRRGPPRSGRRWPAGAPATEGARRAGVRRRPRRWRRRPGGPSGERRKVPLRPPGSRGPRCRKRPRGARRQRPRGPSGPRSRGLLRRRAPGRRTGRASHQAVPVGGKPPLPAGWGRERAPGGRPSTRMPRAAARRARGAADGAEAHHAEGGARQAAPWQGLPAALSLGGGQFVEALEVGEDPRQGELGDGVRRQAPRRW